VVNGSTDVGRVSVAKDHVCRARTVRAALLPRSVTSSRRLLP